MSSDQETLLLTVARVLRAKLVESGLHDDVEDAKLISEALQPFDPCDAKPISECGSRTMANVRR